MKKTKLCKFCRSEIDKKAKVCPLCTKRVSVGWYGPALIIAVIASIIYKMVLAD